MVMIYAHISKYTCILIYIQVAPNDAAEQQKALLMQVLQLSDEQIEALPPQHRDQIRQLVSQ
jgi:hypothetical protein